MGKLYLQKHEGGLDVFDNYDFKGNLLFKTKQVFSDEYIINQLNTHDSNLTTATVNWETASFPHDLDPKEYEVSSQYDALNRVTQLSLPKDLEGERKVFTTEYNRSGALESVQLDGTTYIDRIAYNARGQRILMALGNNTMTRYAYDDTTFWLKRLKTEQYSKDTSIPNQVIYQAQAGTTLQDYAYQYDLSGNIRKIHDKTPNSGYGASPDELSREFSYDAIYRLLSATGRETAKTAAQPWDDTYRPDDHTLARGYTRHYAYDKMGNILTQEHKTSEAGGTNNFTKTFSYQANTNKLVSYSTQTADRTAHSYVHDVNGNIIQEGESRYFEWDAGDNLRAFYIKAGDSVTKYARYLYDSGGNRVKKLVKTGQHFRL